MDRVSALFFSLLLPVLFLSAGCGGLKGEFALKQPMTDEYRRVVGVPEFSGEAKADWAYVFAKVKKTHVIGIILMKKELVWVDINSRTERIDPTQRIVYGTIEGLEKGRYRLLISEKSGPLSEMEFIVYDDFDDEESDMDLEPQ